MKGTTNRRYRYYVKGVTDLKVKNILLRAGVYLYSNRPIFSSAVLTAYPAILVDTDLTLSGSWTLDTGATAAPAEVSGRSASVQGRQITLRWTDPADVDFDHVEITHDQTGGDTAVSVAKGVGLRAFSNLTVGTTYVFTIKTVDAGGHASAGVTVSAVPTDVVAPADVTLPNAARSTGVITLTWVDPVADVDHIEITHDGAGGDTPVSIAAGTQTATFSKLVGGATYTFTIKAVDTAGNKSDGVIVVGSPYGDVSAPSNPTGLGATDGVLSSVLSWTDPTAADFDHIEITHDKTGGDVPLEVDAGVETVLVEDLPAELCTFTLKSVDVNGNKSAGATTTATPTAS